MLEERLDRILRLSESLLEDFHSGRRLSEILPRVRLLATMNNDNHEVAWLDNEIHGVGLMPISSKPKLSTEHQEKGLRKFYELHRVADLSKFPEIVNSIVSSHSLKYTDDSVRSLETFSLSENPEVKKLIYSTYETGAKRMWFTAMECDRVVASIRATVYDYINGVWLDTVQERDNLALLGPDYTIVINSLEALETGVGQELKAALDNLRSNNPANWNLTALGCRNVIIKLADVLWKAPCSTYFSELDGKELDLVGDKEKNRLYAYIDYVYRRSDEQNKDTLKQLKDKIHEIYRIGSKGKHKVKHEEAKNVIVETFYLVSTLDEITELKPVEAI